MIIVLCLLNLAILGGLFVLGHKVILNKNVKRSPAVTDPAFVQPPPKVGLIVPVLGDDPLIAAALASLLDGDYPDLSAVFVTQSADEPAAEIIKQVIKDRRNAAHIVAGAASGVGQKNQNMLAGLSFLPAVDIYVFCDCSHLAGKDFIRELTWPIVSRQAILSSSFHQLNPCGPRAFELPVLGMTITNLGLHLLQGVKFVTQPWGGAMAMSAAAFQEYDIAGLWADKVVDDMTLGPFLQKKGIRNTVVPGALLQSPIDRMDWNTWTDWLTRQIQYLRFCQPLIWILAVLPALILGLAPLLALLTVLLFPWAGAWLALSALFYLAILAGLAWLYLRVLRPDLISAGLSFWAWLKAFLGTMCVVPWCYLRTFGSRIMYWRKIGYRVGRGGKVLEILPRK